MGLRASGRERVFIDALEQRYLLATAVPIQGGPVRLSVIYEQPAVYHVGDRVVATFEDAWYAGSKTDSKLSLFLDRYQDKRVGDPGPPTPYQGKLFFFATSPKDDNQHAFFIAATTAQITQLKDFA